MTGSNSRSGRVRNISKSRHPCEHGADSFGHVVRHLYAQINGSTISKTASLFMISPDEYFRHQSQDGAEPALAASKVGVTTLLCVLRDTPRSGTAITHITLGWKPARSRSQSARLRVRWRVFRRQTATDKTGGKIVHLVSTRPLTRELASALRIRRPCHNTSMPAYSSKCCYWKCRDSEAVVVANGMPANDLQLGEEVLDEFTERSTRAQNV